MKKPTTTAGQLVSISKLIVEKKAPAEDTQGLIDSGLLSDLLDADVSKINRNVFRRFCGLPPLDLLVEISPGILIVDFSSTVEEMIAAGRYDRRNPLVSLGRFQIEPELSVLGEVAYEYMLDWPCRDITTDAELRRIEALSRSNPWQAAELPHLLAFGAACPELQRKSCVVGLGTAEDMGTECFSPCLIGDNLCDNNFRGLDFELANKKWSRRCCFVLVRRVSLRKFF